MSCALRIAPSPDPSLAVIKYGGSVLTGTDGIRRAARELAVRARKGELVVAVVSALRGRTDDLLGLARAVTTNPKSDQLIPLLVMGELEAARLLALAVAASGVRSRAIGMERSHVMTTGDPMDGLPTQVDVLALFDGFRAHEVLVVPGFVGRGTDDEPTLLGRGGGDLTALALAAALRPGRTELVKDVDGVYDRPPADASARRFSQVSWARVVALGTEVVQEKAARFAERYCVSFHVRSFGSSGTLVCAGPDICP